MLRSAIFNREPLLHNQNAPLPLGAVIPRGWLLEQLKTAASGLTGHLYEFWDDVKNSAWRGGDGDGWERAPYYLDGLVPLAWELGDEHLKAVCMEYIEWTLASQREDGFFGPAGNEDWWPRMVMLKVLIQYFTATADKRVPEFMFRYFRYQYQALDEKPLKDWAVARGGENMQSVIWLYNLTGKRFLLKLLEKLQAQTLDWTTHLTIFPFARPLSRLIPWQEMKAGMAREGGPLRGQERPYYNTQYHFSHVVNMAMGIKTPGMLSQFRPGTRDAAAVQPGLGHLMKFHGVASGIFTGDEHINGNSPTQGTECCAVVELMYTAESLLAVGGGDAYLGDLLEKLAFNALPATLTPDMSAHQYLQQVNQIRCTVAPRPWYNNHDDSNIYGLEPNYGCCTANMHQGWPKFCEHLWYASRDGGLTAMSYAPCQVRFRVKGEVPVRITVETAYPFEETVRLNVETAQDVQFPLRLRVPAWAEGAWAKVNGGEEMPLTPGEYALIDREFTKGDKVELHLPLKPRFTRWSRQSAAVEVGPLLMAFRPKEDWELLTERTYCSDWQVTTQEAWNWALVEDGELSVSLAPEKAGPFGWGESAVTVTAEACRLPEWGMKGEDCAPTPVEPRLKAQNMTRITLVPYGDTGLRIGQFPMGKRPETARKE